MFDNNSNIYLYNYEVQLDNIIKAICDLSFDIGTQIHELISTSKDDKSEFNIEDLFKDSFLLSMAIRPESLIKNTDENGDVIEAYSLEEFFAFISDHYNQTLFNIDSFLDGLKGSDILLINKKQSYFLGLGDKAKDRLIPALKAAKILKQLISELKSEKIIKSLEKIEMFENDFFYRNSIKHSKQESQPLLPFLEIKFLDFDKLIKEPVDKDDFWLNFGNYSKLGIDLSAVDEYFVLIDKDDKKEVGLLVGDYLLVYANIDLVDYILKDKLRDYFWLILQKTYSFKSKKNIPPSNDPSVKEFISLREDKALSHLLSNLKNNFYITNPDSIVEKFKAFFNSVVLLEKLEHLNEYQFLMSPNIEQETTLGVYSNIKKEDSYNLLHWLNHNGQNNIDHYRSSVRSEKKKNIIYTLKPTISYYFLEKYFEDFFESILLKKGLTHFSNIYFYEKGNPLCEVDFFVMTEKKFFYFETKTKLTKFYIHDFLKKSSIMIERFKPIIEQGLEVEFILIGAYSDDSVKDYQYFVDENQEMKEKGYNVKRENLNSIPYYFNVPIPDKEGRKITCIAEPEYDNLQKIVQNICQ